MTAPFTDVEWVLDTVDGALVLPDTRVHVVFSSEPVGPGDLLSGGGPADRYDRLAGGSGCNEFSTGYYAVDVGSGGYVVTFSGPPVSSVRGCPSPEAYAQERAVQGVFRGDVHLRHVGDRLTVLDSADTERLVFRRP